MQKALNKTVDYIKPPAFPGNAADYPSWHDQFKNLVVDNTAISPTDKLILLKNSLASGSAQTMVSAVELTDGNFQICWDSILARYNNEREIGHASLRPLFALTPLTFQSQQGLLHILDATQTV